MKKKYPAHIERRAFLLDIASIEGWILVVKDEDTKVWHIGWHELFGLKKYAEAFASQNNWSGPWKAVRASLAVTIQPPKRR